MSQAKQVLQAIRSLPPLSRKAELALKSLQDPDISIPALVEILQYDPAVTVNILKHCNSPLLGVRGTVSSLHQAVVIMGLRQLRKIILAASIERYFPSRSGGYELSHFELWRHSLAVALIAEELANELGGYQADQAFTAGLLHDIGKVIINQFLDTSKAEVIEEVSKGGDFTEVERQVVGLTHMEAGGMILERWHFPPEVQAVARFHHDPPPEPGNSLVILVHMADLVAILAGWGTGLDALFYRANLAIFRSRGINLNRLYQLVSRLTDKVAQLEKDYFPEGERKNAKK